MTISSKKYIQFKRSLFVEVTQIFLFEESCWYYTLAYASRNTFVDIRSPLKKNGVHISKSYSFQKRNNFVTGTGVPV